MTKNSKSIPQLLRLLFKEGFFATAKGLPEISQALITMGYRLRSSSLAAELIHSVGPDGFLSRNNESGKWKYVQKKSPEFVEKKEKESKGFDGYDFHPRIKDVALSQFNNKDYKGAILNAFIEVVDHVKNKTGNPKDKNGKDLDGDDLMNKTFGCDGDQEPKIKFNILSNGLDHAEQRGIMYLFKGVVGVRDKKAHLNFIQNDPMKTIEYLALASLLLRLVDENSTNVE